MGGTCAVREEPGKQKPRSCRTQELARSSARENVWQKKTRVPSSVGSEGEQNTDPETGWRESRKTVTN
jgi:hypothetical protein